MITLYNVVYTTVNIKWETTGRFLLNLQGGHLRFWTFSSQILDLLKRLWTFLYAAWLSGLDISQNIQKRF